VNAQLSLEDIPTAVDAKARWQDDATAWLRLWLTTHPILFCEDVQAQLADAVGPPGDKAWLGPVVRRLAAVGAIRKDGYRQGSNGSPKDVWRSQRYFG
jgi:hypothetical protein